MTAARPRRPTVRIYKQVGGYETYVKVRGRWYWVCGSGNVTAPGLLRIFNEAAARAGVRLERKGPLPAPVRRAWRTTGATFASVAKALPQWTEAIGF